MCCGAGRCRGPLPHKSCLHKAGPRPESLPAGVRGSRWRDAGLRGALPPTPHWRGAPSRPGLICVETTLSGSRRTSALVPSRLCVHPPELTAPWWPAVGVRLPRTLAASAACRWECLAGVPGASSGSGAEELGERRGHLLIFEIPVGFTSASGVPACVCTGPCVFVFCFFDLFLAALGFF